MTPRQACVVLAGFLMLALGVAFNALYLQGDVNRRSTAERPSAGPPADRGKRTDAQPARPGPRTPEQPKRASMLKADVAKAEAAPQPPPPEEADADTVRAIQRELKQRGFGPLAVDGVMRPATRAAIMAFEHDSRLPITAEASAGLLKRILLGESAASAGSGAGEVRSPQAEALVRLVQRQLAARGYRPGAIDGRLSVETMAAIRVFEADQGLEPKGRVSAEVLARLGDRPPEPKSAAAR
jgi:peptidoglycan hydrolase-like protein with peptidoglycan-binding domain